MALSIYDFTKGIDFTGLGGSATAADHNNLVDIGTPYTDKGLVGQTTDSALDTPVVPDAATTTKWKKYLWVRIPDASATVQIPKIYFWNDNLVSDATYLKWVRITADTSVELALIAALDVRLDAAEADIDSTLILVNAANTNAANAAIDAANALDAATAAQTDAAAALVAATAAQTTANTADANATAALTAAGTASTNASSALTAASAASTAAGLVTAIQSDDFPLTVNSQIAQISHGLGVVPKSIRWVLHCITDDSLTLHVAGDEVPIEDFSYTVPPNYDYIPFYSRANATHIILRLINATPETWKTNGSATIPVAITLANWKARCYYSKN